MLNNQIISIFFRILNLFIILILLFYIFKKYLINSIKNKIIEKKEDLKRLEEKSNDIMNQSSNLDKDFLNQEQFFSKLSFKIKNWKVAFDKKLYKKIIEHELIKTKIENNLKLKEYSLTMQNLKKQTLLHGINQAELELKKQYKDQDSQLMFKNNLLSFLKNNL